MEEIRQEGYSTLIIGRGRAGKSGFTFDLIEEEDHPEKYLIIAPRRTIKAKMDGLDFVDWPIMSADDLEQAWNDHAEKNTKGPLLVLIFEKFKGQKSIFEILQDERFRGFTIHVEEMAIMTSDLEDWKAFDKLIRVVGQSDQHLYANTHRIKRELDPAWLANFQKIYFVGSLFAKDEAQILYDNSTVSNEMTFEEFEGKLKNQPKKYNWWDPSPDKGSVFLIYG